MTEPSPLPPRRRDTRNLADLIRQDRQNLAHRGVGFVGGRFPLARPLGSTAQFGDEEDGGPDTILFLNTDTGTVAANGVAVTIQLTHVPIEGSEQVYYRGMALRRTDWYRTDTAVTIPAERWFKAADEAWIDYAYDDVEDVVDTPSLLFVGATTVQGSTSSIAIPAGTQSGDLLVLSSAAWNTATSSDTRLTGDLSNNSAGHLVMWGFATSSTSPITCAVDGGIFNYAATILAAYRGPTSVSDSAVVGSTGADISMPVETAATAAIGLLLAWDSGVPGVLTGDTTGQWAQNAFCDQTKAHTTVNSWTAESPQDTPPGSFHTTGSTGNGFLAAILKVG